MDEIQQVEARLERLPAGEERLSETLKAFTERRHVADRSFIVKCVVSLYVAAIAAAILYLLIRGLWASEDRFKDISEMIKIGVIPVLTLVIGYYFGTERR
jgi:hypothetical protein